MIMMIQGKVQMSYLLCFVGSKIPFHCQVYWQNKDESTWHVCVRKWWYKHHVVKIAHTQTPSRLFSYLLSFPWGSYKRRQTLARKVYWGDACTGAGGVQGLSGGGGGGGGGASWQEEGLANKKFTLSSFGRARLVVLLYGLMSIPGKYMICFFPQQK